MKRVGVLILVFGLVGVLASVSPIQAQTRRVVAIASGAVDGVYFPIAGALSRIATDTKELNVRAVVESSGGAVANAQLIGRGEADFAVLQNDIAYYAFNGVGLTVFAGKPVKKMSGVFALYPEVIHVVATQASSVKSVRDLKGKRVVLGPPGSGTEQNAIQVLAAHGLAETDLRSAERAPFTTAVEQMKSGLIDAAFFTTAFGAPVVADALESGKLSLIPVGRETLERKCPFYTAGEIPARTYKGQDQAVPVPAVMAMLVARSNLSEDLVYRFIRAVFDNLAAFHAAHPAARSLSPQTALVAIPLPLHPGAERFFRDRGIAR